MGVVYRATDTRIGRDVAIKVLPEAVLNDDGRTSRFLREAKIVSRLNHPHILTVHEVDRCESGLYIVTELVDGMTLRAMIRERPLRPGRVMDLLRQAAAGLGKAHAADVVHRDIKPENVMVTDDGILKILDFGVAKALSNEGELETADLLTKTGNISGTPGYIAPEHLLGKPIDSRTDIFAVGVLVHELLTGKHPFAGKNVAEIIHATLHRRPPKLSELDPELSEEFALLIDRCLSQDPERRPQDGQALAEELKKVSPLRAEVSSRARRAQRGLMRRIADMVDGLMSRGPVREEPSPVVVQEKAKPSDDAVVPEQLVVAVLPVADRSGDASLETAGAGRILTDVFLHLLTDGASMQVVSPFLLREAAEKIGRPLARVAEDPGSTRSIGETVGANAVLTGALEKVADGFVLGATITELDTGRVYRSYRAEAPQWEQLLSELATSVRDRSRTTPGSGTEPESPGNGRAALRVDDTPDSGRLVERLPSQSLEAYAHFVRGRDLADLGRYAESIPLLEKAVELDPGLAVAWSEMGCAYSFTGDTVRARAAHWKAEEHIAQASLKERLWINANTVWVNTENGDLYRKKLQEFIDTFPDDRDGYLYMGYSFLELDEKPAEAIPWLEIGYELTPGFLPATKALFEAYSMIGDAGKARDVLERYLALPSAPEFGKKEAERLLQKVGEPVGKGRLKADRTDT